MSLQLRATKHQLADLKRLVEVGPDRLSSVHAKVAGLAKLTLRPRELLDEVGEILGQADAEPLVRQLLSIQGIVRQSGLPVQEVISGVRAAIEEQSLDNAFNVCEWLKIERILSSLVELKCVRLAATALELAYDYANLLKRTKILTDIRPLYNESGDAIEAAVVSYTLRLKYDSADGDHELSIALDEADIKSLMRQCERAVKKAATARNLMVEMCNLSVSIPGEVDDD
jgi:hypothetical protein